MSDVQWMDVRAAFERALGIEPTERRRFVATLEPAELRRRVAELLEADANGPSIEGVIDALRSDHAEASLAGVEGRTFGRYRLGRELGRGAMGVVHEATHLDLGRSVALKILHVLQGSDRERRERFLREARTAARLHHTHIVSVFDVGEVDGVPFYAMEFVDGRAWDRLVGSAETTPDRVAELGARVARALEYAHDRGVVHRDIKPANLLLGDDGTPWITDFGLARHVDDAGLTRTGAVLGTPRFMSPEQAAGDPVDERTDLYALGATLYELLSREPLFRGGSTGEVLSRVLSECPLPLRQLVPGVPRDLETIVHKLVEKRPADRYSSAAALAEDLERFGRREPIAARRASWALRARRFAQRNPALTAVTAGLFMVLATGLVVSLVLLGQRDAALSDSRADFDLTRDALRRVTAVALDDLLWEPRSAALRRGFLEASLEYYRALLARRDDRVDLRRETAVAQLGMGRVLQLLGDLDAARPALEAAVDGLQSGSVPPPVVFADRAEAWSSLGDLEFEVGDLVAAEQAYSRALQAFDALADAPRPEEKRVGDSIARASVVRRLARIEFREGRIPESMETVKEAVRSLVPLLDAGHLLATDELIECQVVMGRALEARGDRENAMATYRRLLGLNDRFVAGMPRTVDVVLRSARGRIDLAALVADEEPEEADRLLVAARELLDPLLTDHPDLPDPLMNSALHHAVRGRVSLERAVSAGESEGETAWRARAEQDFATADAELERLRSEFPAASRRLAAVDARQALEAGRQALGELRDG